MSFIQFIWLLCSEKKCVRVFQITSSYHSYRAYRNVCQSVHQNSAVENNIHLNGICIRYFYAPESSSFHVTDANNITLITLSNEKHKFECDRSWFNSHTLTHTHRHRLNTWNTFHSMRQAFFGAVNVDYRFPRGIAPHTFNIVFASYSSASIHMPYDTKCICM